MMAEELMASTEEMTTERWRKALARELEAMAGRLRDLAAGAEPRNYKQPGVEALREERGARHG